MVTRGIALGVPAIGPSPFTARRQRTGQGGKTSRVADQTAAHFVHAPLALYARDGAKATCETAAPAKSPGSREKPSHGGEPFPGRVVRILLAAASAGLVALEGAAAER